MLQLMNIWYYNTHKKGPKEKNSQKDPKSEFYDQVIFGSPLFRSLEVTSLITSLLTKCPVLPGTRPTVWQAGVKWLMLVFCLRLREASSSNYTSYEEMGNSLLSL